MSTRIEFAVKMTCDSCEKKVREKLLENKTNVSKFDIDRATNTVIIETSLPSSTILSELQSTGLTTKLKGYGDTSAAVCILEAGNPTVKGVVRFVQDGTDSCVVDGTVDGLFEKQYKIDVHEMGDISDGCNSVGDIYDPRSTQSGKSKTIDSDENGRATFKYLDDSLSLCDVIGRSLVIKTMENKRIACGIIARSAGVFQNPKTICACDGTNIWNEKI